MTKHRTRGGDFTTVDALSIGPADVAHLMVLLKVARAVHGDPTNQDHYVDGAGYMSLAGALSMGEKRVEVPKVPEQIAPAKMEAYKTGERTAASPAATANSTLAAARAVDASEQK